MWQRRQNSPGTVQLALCLSLAAILGCTSGEHGDTPPERAATAAQDAGTQEADISVEIDPQSPTAPASFVIRGLNKVELDAFEQLDAMQRAALFRLVTRGALTDPPPIAGNLTRREETLRFVPRYPLEPGVPYRAVFERALLSPAGDTPPVPGLTLDYELAAVPPASQTTVTHIYPSSDRLPENQLKFYLFFSAPMSRGEAYRHVRLLDAEGREVEAAFLELGEELWDRQQRRFTLLCDPGRVKRGLKPREELGPVLVEGRQYTLEVDAGWHDATGATLASGARKSFRVLAPDDTPIDPAAWRLATPQAGSRAPLVARFPEPLDRALVERMLRVDSAAGDSIAGTVEIADGETAWQFVPEKPWAEGEYQLTIDRALEDLAGNAVGRAFDVDVFGPVQKQITTETVSLPFRVTSRE